MFSRRVLGFVRRRWVWIVVAVVLVASVVWFRATEPFAEESSLCGGTYFREIPNFLTHAQCDALVAAAESRGLIPSEVGGVDDGRLDLSVRVSEQTWFSPGQHPVTDVIRKKTAAVLAAAVGSGGACIPKYKFEDIQVARYVPGGKYDEHHDGTECVDGTCPANQRLTTLMVYLSEPEGGGRTRFPLLGKSVAPRKGSALFFWVADPASRDIFEKTLHAGEPVTRGTKWIANQWSTTVD